MTSPWSPGSHSLSQPRPRAPKSAQEVTKIRLQNRRREWLERNPEYLDNIDHEFADPVLYEALVRRYQSANERQSDAKAKGYSRILEGDLLRGEAKLATMAGGYQPDRGQGASQISVGGPEATTQTQRGVSELLDLDPPRGKAEALQRWNDFLTDRFVRGEDEDFDYDKVDKNDEYDAAERREKQEEWFDEEEPSWAGDEDAGIGRQEERMLHGETGIQDF